MSDRSPSPRVLIVGNYGPDEQQSMRRYAEWLQSLLADHGVPSHIMQPPIVLGRLKRAVPGSLFKWLAYVDKFVVFPVLLLLVQLLDPLMRRRHLFHLADHSNAVVMWCLPRTRTLVTCHDVLAIRGARGHADAYCPASRSGKILQTRILRGLARARTIICVSETTRRQLNELFVEDSLNSDDRQMPVIHHALNADFERVSGAALSACLASAGVDQDVPYLLHVGSALPRKNRRLVLELLDGDSAWHGNVVLAGASVEQDLCDELVDSVHASRVLNIVRPDHEQLNALYSGCSAFIFPSLSEGFGWPVMEAQACAAPVVASRYEPMPEVGGDGAVYGDPLDAQTFRDAVRRLDDEAARADLVERGLRNLRRFDPEHVAELYLKAYQRVGARC